MQRKNRKLMAILAHPDDESLGLGGTLIKYASEGVDTHLIMATRGERGRYGKGLKSPGLDLTGRKRTAELLAASEVLRLREIAFLGYIDGDLDKANATEIIAKITKHIRRVRPHVIVTFGPEGAYGHPDHIAISQFTTAAIVKAADSNFSTNGYASYSVPKLYYLAWPPAKWKAYQTAFKELSMTVDGVKRQAAPFPDWAITTKVDTTKYWATAWKAILCHQTQMSVYGNLRNLSPEQHIDLWGKQEFYRVFSLVNGGRKLEMDLFEGIPEDRLKPQSLKLQNAP